MPIQEYIVVYDICYCDMAGRDTYFCKNCIVVEHVFCICPPYFDGGLTLHQSEAKVIGSSLAGMRN